VIDLKILSVCSSIPGNDSRSWRILSIAKLLKTCGHDVHFVYYCSRHSYNTLRREEDDTDTSFVIASPFTVHLNHLKYILNSEYDLVYGNTYTGTFFSLLGKLARMPIIFDMHGGALEEFLLQNYFELSPKYMYNYLLRRTMEAINLKSCDKIFCVSHKMINYLHRVKGISLEKMVYITNGVDLTTFKSSSRQHLQAIREDLGFDDRVVFGYIGNFDKWQGVENLITAATNCRDKTIGFLTVGGQRNTKSSKIVSIPSAPRSQVLDYYSICDILVLPRPHHIATEIAAPTKFAEYAAMGKPILTTEVGDAADFVRRYKCGIVVKDNDPDSLLRGIREFQELSKDDLTIMGLNSRKLAEREFDWNICREGLNKTILELSK